MNTVQEDRRSLTLLLTLLMFFVSAPFLEGHPIGDLILTFALFILLLAAIVELSAKRVSLQFCVPLVIVSTPLLSPVSSLLTKRPTTNRRSCRNIRRECWIHISMEQSLG